jgi:rhodanese-related sulfurtransferase
VPGAVNVPQADLATRLAELPSDRPLLVVCQGGYRSLRAAQFLRQAGFDQVASVQGGTDAWRTAGHPVETEAGAAEGPRVVESEWAHAGAATYAI